MKVSDHTEVNFWIVIHRHVDFLLRLGWASVVRWWVVVRDHLHGLFDELVTFIFEAFSIAELSGVDTATKVIVLRGRRRRSVTRVRVDLA